MGCDGGASSCGRGSGVEAMVAVEAVRVWVVDGLFIVVVWFMVLCG